MLVSKMLKEILNSCDAISHYSSFMESSIFGSDDKQELLVMLVNISALIQMNIQLMILLLFYRSRKNNTYCCYNKSAERL